MDGVRPYARPNILHLTGISFSDYLPVEDFYDTNLIDGAVDDARAGGEAPDEDSLPPDRIPHRFTSLEEWPLRTNLRCWECDCTFDDRPKFAPTYVREAEMGGLEVGVRGNFCTFNCAELWIEVHFAGKPDLLWRAQSALCLVYFLFTGYRVSRILPAPDKTERREYGGEWTIDTFWARLRALDPIAGLRDHTPGSVVSERARAVTSLVPERVRGAPVPLELRGAAVVAIYREQSSWAGPAPLGPSRPGSVWDACGVAPTGLPPAPDPSGLPPAPDPSGLPPASVPSCPAPAPGPDPPPPASRPRAAGGPADTVSLEPAPGSPGGGAPGGPAPSAAGTEGPPGAPAGHAAELTNEDLADLLGVDLLSALGEP